MSSGEAVRRARARRELIRHLRSAGALSDAAARPIEADTPLERSVLKSMLKREVIRPGSKGGYWLDEERYAEWKRQNLVIGIGVALVMGGIIACLMIYEPSHPRHPQHPATAADSVARADSVSGGPDAGQAPPP